MQLREGESGYDVDRRKRESDKWCSSERRVERECVKWERVEEEAEAVRMKEAEA
jgi:hypothetical protein